MKCDVHAVQLLCKLLFKFTALRQNNRQPFILVAVCIIATNFKRCLIIASIATNHCLLHLTSITTHTNSLQHMYITSKTSSLH
jgi:hypothetical protein